MLRSVLLLGLLQPVLLAGAGCLALPGDERGGSALGEPVDWTLLVYAANDDPSPRLTAGFDADAEEWARFVGGSKRFRVVVQRDFSRRNPGNPPTERFVLERGEKLHPETLAPGSLVLGETNTSDPATLRSFLEDSIRAFPAERTWLVVTGHGDDWMGLAPDASDPLGRPLPLAGFRDALAAATTGALAEVRAVVPGSPRLDVVQLDACRMGSIEVATELAPVADHLVASQENEPSAGHPYGAFYALAQNHLGSAPRTAAAEVVLDYVRAYNPTLSTRPGRYVGTSITAVALDLQRLGALTEAMAALSREIRASRPAGLSCAEIDTLRAALAERGTVEPDAAVGMPDDASEEPLAARAAVDLVALLGVMAVEHGALGPGARAAAGRALEVIGRPDERFDPNRRWGFVHLTGFPASSPFVTEAHSLAELGGPSPTGLSILLGRDRDLFAGTSSPLARYRALAFDLATGWSSLLDGCAAEPAE